MTNDEQSATIKSKVYEARRESERKAWDSLSRYKFEMFGYWSSAWVKYNQLFDQAERLPNPFRNLVIAAREVKANEN